MMFTFYICVDLCWYPCQQSVSKYYYQIIVSIVNQTSKSVTKFIDLYRINLMIYQYFCCYFLWKINKVNIIENNKYFCSEHMVASGKFNDSLSSSDHCKDTLKTRINKQLRPVCPETSAEQILAIQWTTATIQKVVGLLWQECIPALCRAQSDSVNE